jgi:hypothetical protein
MRLAKFASLIQVDGLHWDRLAIKRSAFFISQKHWLYFLTRLRS